MAYFRPMLTATGIEKKYGPIQVLKGVGLQVQKGEVVSIVGSSGAGKYFATYNRHIG